ncbi:MAG: EamA family transporter [[Clostridium] symbiosum]|uniref:Amino-acid metabolite efflux pump n=1 Tax=Anaerotignum propionicum DSM 1682 TaxID=991789 RepID=A0A0X1U8I4_ANAPI|nr:EamA family transporter [Anaerotignum propionicum]AMJ41231.1 putative amino-acid metabolite efflux pump [Anaerotignum propionicum DSM 1682]MEA4841928.1 EamA family transporter [[Clostridium] symbiosum]SHF11869.1 O-acetylserine/cysteine efflux transporter [[Clostridium] propionicum DSM 1682] [Anaerotignum propionicum DSM 1682]
MKLRDRGLAVFVIILWGINFTVIKFGINEMSPMLLVTLRYIFAALPAIFFVKRPDTNWKYIVAYGLAVGVGQFSCLFYAEYIGMPAGVASVVLQAQAFFTILLAGVLFKERIGAGQIAGLIVACMGLILISGSIGAQGGGTVIPGKAFLLTIIAALFWGISNIIIRYASKEAEEQGKNLNMFNMVIWSSSVPPIPMMMAALIIDKPVQVWYQLSHINVLALFSILYLAFFATLIGYGLWSTLLAKYPASKIAPLSLLVPVVGLTTAQKLLGEKLTTIQWIGGLIIIFGLLISNFSNLLRNTCFKNFGKSKI